MAVQRVERLPGERAMAAEAAARLSRAVTGGADGSRSWRDPRVADAVVA